TKRNPNQGRVERAPSLDLLFLRGGFEDLIGTLGDESRKERSIRHRIASSKLVVATHDAFAPAFREPCLDLACEGRGLLQELRWSAFNRSSDRVELDSFCGEELVELFERFE